MMCHCLEIIQGYENGFMGGPKEICFDFNDINISIIQQGVRIIRLSRSGGAEIKDLYHVFCSFEKLCVLCEGQYLDIKGVNAYNESGNILENSISCEELKSKRLTCCSTIDVLRGDKSRLLDVFEILNPIILENWTNLEKELGIIHQSFLYNTSSIGFPVDGKIASIIESFEPLIELITFYTNQFSSLKPGEHGTTLKMCLDACISVYGTDIFKTEYSINAEKFLQCLVASRNKIMHIKRNYNSICFTGPESILYIVKLTFLYRSILLSILHVDYSLYREKMAKSVQEWETWNNVFQSFVDKNLKSNSPTE